MNQDIALPPGGRAFYRLRPGSLQQRLALLMPGVAVHRLRITTRELAGNASFVNHVRHHHIEDPDSGQVVELVEKSIRKVALIGSQEARLHRHARLLEGCTAFDHPPFHGVIDTPFESLLYTGFASGKPPRMHLIGGPLAQGIAELEHRSHSYLEQQSAGQRPLLWCMDFFRPWFVLRPRFNYRRCLPHLRALASRDARFAGLAQPLAALGPLLSRLARQARRSPRCVCHMDYLRKNLLIERKRLLLLDWGEMKIGRIGFDGGAYLGALFRRSDMARFEQARQQFLETYTQALDPAFDTDQALANLEYIFLLTALYHCLRPETLAEYEARARMPLLREKYDYLLRHASGLHL